jgi:hypothetical protein
MVAFKAFGYQCWCASNSFGCIVVQPFEAFFAVIFGNFLVKKKERLQI